MSAGLKSRLVRLERVTRQLRLPQIVMAIFDQPDQSVIGAFADRNGERLTVLRLGLDEPLEMLRDRAFGIVGGYDLYLLYGVPEATAAAELTLGSPGPAPRGEPGIGSIATTQQLERMGAITVPPEWMI